VRRIVPPSWFYHENVSYPQPGPISVRALTPEYWDSLDDLFDNKGPCGRCWCMYFRIGSLYRKRSAQENRADFRQVVENGPPPGLLAFVNDQAVGWCQLTPRVDLPSLNHQWRLRSIDSTPVWCISCLYVRIGFRRKGITSALIAGALKAAQRTTSRGSCVGGLPSRCGKISVCIGYWVRNHLSTGRIQDRGSPKSRETDHAA
jgi:hypothetical protein